MVKMIAMVIGFMILIFSLVTTITPGSNGYQQTNPIIEFAKDIARPFKKVDRIGPDISNAIERTGVRLPVLPALGGDKEGDTYTLQDHTSASFANMDLPRASFAGSVMTLVQANNALLDGADFEAANGDEVNFNGARMANTNLNAAVFTNSDFTGAELREATARAGEFTGSSFVGADISFSSFSGAKLNDVDFSKTYGAGALFVDADLRKANFSGADLTGVRLENAKLKGALFDSANLTSASLDGTDLSGVDLSGALNLTVEQLAQTCGDADTKLPEGLAAPRC